ncbi:MAG TPA: hypothetical protein DCL21_00720 [Alphaproteobacteria bacterium]|nr:hypothetical protein [Alphaproteobacteria bacterium]
MDDIIHNSNLSKRQIRINRITEALNNDHDLQDFFIACNIEPKKKDLFFVSFQPDDVSYDIDKLRKLFFLTERPESFADGKVLSLDGLSGYEVKYIINHRHHTLVSKKNFLVDTLTELEIEVPDKYKFVSNKLIAELTDKAIKHLRQDLVQAFKQRLEELDSAKKPEPA